MDRTDKILVNSHELRGIASRIRQMETSIESIEAAADALIHETEGSWIGKARDEAGDNFDKLREKTSALREQLRKRAQSIEEVCAVYEETEKGISSEVQDLSVDHIFG